MIEGRVKPLTTMASSVRYFRFLIALGLGLVMTVVSATGAPVHTAVTTPQDLADPDLAVRKAAILALARSGDAALVQLLDDYKAGNLYVLEGRLVLILETFENDDWDEIGKILDPMTRRPHAVAENVSSEFLIDELGDLSPSPQEYRTLRGAKVIVDLADSDPKKRKAAAKKAGDMGDLAMVPLLEEFMGKPGNDSLKRVFEESLHLIRLKNHGSLETAEVLVAVQRLRALHSARALTDLEALVKETSDPGTKEEAKNALKSIESWQDLARGLGHLFSGISLGSILILMALGLSIIFGLMGVINMAHGELMMIGAYTAYILQLFFVRFMPEGAFNWYFVCAVPVSFLCAAIVGVVIEVLVIRHLYGRPLETLLATWGISLVLIQAVRLMFGDNIAVNSPTWLRGGVELLPGFVLPFNRIFIIVLTIGCVALTYAIMGRTKIGLLIRATTQNRNMARSLGVSTRRVDAYTFGFGAGLAGVAGCALTLIGGVTPDMGQNYIVDSFLVVVTGGVGKLAGAVWAGFGLGVLNKIFEPFFAAVWAKVLILVCVVFFIQWRPSGLFPPKGRLADAK